jgi:hypothetical protein
MLSLGGEGLHMVSHGLVDSVRSFLYRYFDEIGLGVGEKFVWVDKNDIVVEREMNGFGCGWSCRVGESSSDRI